MFEAHSRKTVIHTSFGLDLAQAAFHERICFALSLLLIDKEQQI